MEERAGLAWKISEIGVGKGGYVMCWIGFPGEDLKPVAYMQGEGDVEGGKTNWEEVEKTGEFAMEAVQNVIKVYLDNIWEKKSWRVVGNSNVVRMFCTRYTL